MATTTTSLTPFSTLTHTQLFTVLSTLLLLTNPIPSNSYLLEPRVTDISAVPAFLPVEPTISSIPPTLAPDMMPLFPSPGGNAKAAPAGTLPTVPSNPSAPNPDKLQPNSASSLGNLGKGSAVMVCGLVLLWWLELMDKRCSASDLFFSHFFVLVFSYLCAGSNILEAVFYLIDYIVNGSKGGGVMCYHAMMIFFFPPKHFLSKTQVHRENGEYSILSLHLHAGFLLQ